VCVKGNAGTLNVSGMRMLSYFIRVLQVMYFVSHHACSNFVLAG
jgi:hypothetical protein